MGRKEVVYDTLHSLSKEITLERFKQKDRLGFSVYDIEKIVDIDRTNISRYLNVLFREGHVIKLLGKPVLFMSKQALEELLSIKVTGNEIEISNQSQITELYKVTKEQIEPLVTKREVFQNLIGYDRSLKNQIEQAKAAITYPPKGLTTLILGQTGVGKTLFANIMYKFALDLGRMKPNSKFIVFNCADYSYNPQLIMAQLFGYVQGAFTGADKDKSGLVEKADGGILFLDEVHRLPAEAQEMLFYLMDCGMYRRLGEIENNRTANPFIIAATTEEPNSKLLNTFMRRIPVIIKLPSLNERGLDERLSLIKEIFKQEATIVERSIVLSSQVIKYFLTYECNGNIGQLKGDIKLICARAYMKSLIESERKLVIDDKILLECFDEKVIKLRSYSKSLENVYIQDPTTIIPKDNGFEHELPLEVETSVYKFVKNNLYTYSDGYTNGPLNDPISLVKKYFSGFLDYYKGNEKDQREKLLEFIDDRIIDTIREFLKVAQIKYNLNIDFYYVTPLIIHINTIIEQLSKDIRIQGYLPGEKEEEELSFYLSLSKELAALIESVINVEIPYGENVVIALIIKNIVEGERSRGEVPILVMAHGDGVASSIASVANHLMDKQCVHYIDMPFEEKWETTFNKALEKCKMINAGEGILLFIDMGSLFNVAEEITKATGIPVKVISYANTLLVLEAAQKSYYGKMTLNELYYEMQRIKKDMFYSEDIHTIQNENFDKEDLYIVTTCMTGNGTALKIKEMIEENFLFSTEVKIRPIDVISTDDLEQRIINLCDGHKPLMIVGTVRPKRLTSQFISLEEIVFGQGLLWIEKLLVKSGVYISRVNDENEDKTSKMMGYHNEAIVSVLRNYLYYLDADKTLKNVAFAIKGIEEQLGKSLNRKICTNLIVHICCMLERLIFSDDEENENDNKKDINAVDLCSYLEKPINELGNKYKIKVSYEEKRYIHEIIVFGMNEQQQDLK